ncbi:MAG: transglutaminase-like domain-containing protein [Chloroflexota bacterium]
MLLELLIRFWERYRPREGWLSLFLLMGALGCLTFSIGAVRWVPEVGVVTFNGFLGLLLGVVVARSALRPLSAWLLLLAYGLLLTTAYLGSLSPPLFTLLQGEGAIYFRQQWALLWDRLAGWYISVSGGGSSRETLVFAFGLGLAIWLLAAYSAWATYRRQQPLTALTLMGLGLALNGYFGGEEAPIWLFAFFIGFSTLLAAAMHFAQLEKSWLAHGIDYSREIRLELLAAAGGAALLLATLALSVPSIRLSALAQAFQESEPVQQTEGAVERAFAGVRQPRQQVVAFAGQSAGILPRSFLLGNAPSLYETVVMTATARPATASRYWRALSYDAYTGRGWALSQERQEQLGAGAPIPQPAAEAQTTVTQTVRWRLDEPLLRHTAGVPLRFEDSVTVYWRGQNDFVRVTGGGDAYTATSRVSNATPEQLRQARPQEGPAALLSRYTQLPAGLPRRVRQLAQEVAAEQPTAYDQARALQAFLRQYPYSLDVRRPPAGDDPVDFFLFELQRGYCDYYASAMVVMARALGLPARLVIGYLAPAADGAGVQTIYQINAHAWPEIYFAGYGWIPFEPTAPFSPPAGEAPEERSPGVRELEQPPASPPIPRRESRPLWLWALLLAGAAALGFWFWRRRTASRSPLAADPILHNYDRLLRSARRLGQPTPDSQTPAEFQNALLARLTAWEQRPWLSRRLRGLRHNVRRLTTLFIARQYSGRRLPPIATRQAQELWRNMARRLQLLAILKKFRRDAD